MTKSTTSSMRGGSSVKSAKSASTVNSKNTTHASVLSEVQSSKKPPLPPTALRRRDMPKIQTDSISVNTYTTDTASPDFSLQKLAVVDPSGESAGVSDEETRESIENRELFDVFLDRDEEIEVFLHPSLSEGGVSTVPSASTRSVVGSKFKPDPSVGGSASVRSTSSTKASVPSVGSASFKSTGTTKELTKSDSRSTQGSSKMGRVSSHLSRMSKSSQTTSETSNKAAERIGKCASNIICLPSGETSPTSHLTARMTFHKEPVDIILQEPPAKLRTDPPESDGEESSGLWDEPEKKPEESNPEDIEETKIVIGPPAPTLLHAICQNAKSVEELLEARTQISVNAAATTDAYGRTPLHIVSLNHNISMLTHRHHEPAAPAAEVIHKFMSDMNLATQSLDAFQTSDAERELTEFIVVHLWKAYRAAMITPDQQGNIPFQAALTDWVLDSYGPKTPQSTRSFWLPSKSLRARFSAHGALAGNQNGMETEHNGSNGGETPKDLESGTPTSTASSLFLVRAGRQSSFPRVSLTPHSLFCFKILSAMIDRMEERVHSSRNGHRGSQWSLRNDPDGLHIDTALKELNNMTVEDISAEIVQSIASIPDLVKTVLLIANETHRNFILSTTIMRRVLASKYSVGGWLTAMLQSSSKRITDRAIEYLNIVSTPDLFASRQGEQSRRGSWRRSKSSHSITAPPAGQINLNKHEQDELYNEVSRIQDFVPSLLALGEKDVEEVSTTRLVSKVLDQLICRPFAATVILCDAIFLAILLTGFRLGVTRLLLGWSAESVANFLYMSNCGIFYFIIRELGKIVSLLMLTRRTLIYFWSFWNLTDLMSTLLALASVISVRSHLSSRDSNEVPHQLRNLLAVTTGFIWLRVLSFLKGINMQLATFVLAILQITRDVLWFCVILLTLVVAFAQMFYTLLVPETCGVEGSDTGKQCYQSEYYLSVYAILLGDFGTFQRESFTSFFSIFLAVLFTFIVVLVLLNVLIAVASDSYEKCLVRSRNLFGRARVMLIAELVSFQNLLKRTGKKQPQAPQRVYKDWWSEGSWIKGWSRGSIMFFTLSSTVVVIWIVSETSGLLSGNRYGNIWMSLISIFVIVVLFVGIMVFLSTGASTIVTRLNVTKNSSEDDHHASPHCCDWYGRLVQRVMLRLLGNSEIASGPAGPESEAWRGRLVFLQEEMVRLAEESREQSDQKVHALEQLIHQTEARLKIEFATLDRGLGEIRLQVVSQHGQPKRRKSEIGSSMSMSGLFEALKSGSSTGRE